MGDIKRLKDLGVTNTDEELEGYLKHHGILGMKWGIRRYQPYPKGKGSRGKYVGDKSKKKASSGIDDRLQKAVKDGSATITTDPKTGKRRVKFKNGEEWNMGASADFKKSKKQKTSPKVAAKQMTDDELRKTINRMQMEKQYTQLTSSEKSKGRKIVEEMIAKPIKTGITGTITLIVARELQKRIASR